MKKKIFILAALFYCLQLNIAGQVKKLEYNIKRNGDIVGKILINKTITGNRITLKMESEVKTRFIFAITTKAKEESIFDNGIMTWSSIYRKQNGSVKADKRMKANGNIYTLYNGNKTETLYNYPIRYNMLSIYYTEPLEVSKIYSENFQQLLDIQKMNANHYKIKFPDGNYNEYYYLNGYCSKVEIHNSLYRATVELKK